MIVEEDGTLSPPNYHNNKESASKQMHTEDPLALMMERKISLSLSLSLFKFDIPFSRNWRGTNSLSLDNP